MTKKGGQSAGTLTLPSPAKGEASGRPSIALGVLRVAAVLTATAFLAMLGMQRLVGADLGYHLAYGESFWNTGRIVDCSQDILYTLSSNERRPVGPGCWYDVEGHYRFPNANWLTQVLLAAVWKGGGEDGLCGLKLLLVLALAALSLKTLRNLSVSWSVSAAALLLMGLLSYHRLLMRPELLSFVLLAGQLAILTRRHGGVASGRWPVAGSPFSGPDYRQPATGDQDFLPGWKAFAGLAVLQLLLVNVHSYFLLGLAMTAAMLADRGLRLWWASGSGSRGAEAASELRRSTVRLAILLAAQAAVCFINPWTWRLAVLPFQTLWFLHQQKVAAASGQPAPWLEIREFTAPFASDVRLAPQMFGALCAYLALAGIGAAAAAWTRRWASLLLIAGVTAVALTMQRNLPFAALLGLPMALGAMSPLASKSANRMRAEARQKVSAAAAVVILLAGASLVLLVATQRFYATHQLRFGWGLGRLELGMGPASWLNEHRPEGRLWTDYNSSSNMHYFTSPHQAVPALTNTWAFPPAVMQGVLAASRGRMSVEEFQRQFQPEIVVTTLEASSASLRRGEPGLLPLLAANSRWAPVCVDGNFVVFLHTGGVNADLASRCRLSDSSYDADAAIARIEKFDPAPADRLVDGGGTLETLGWHGSAITLLERACGHWGSRNPKAWNTLGMCYAQRANAQDPQRPEAQADFQNAGRCFKKALELDPNYANARQNLATWRQQGPLFLKSPTK